MKLLRDDLPTSAHYIHMVRKLANLLGVSESEDAILDYRTGQKEKDYLDVLWDEASIGALIIDDGFRKDDMISPSKLRTICQRPIYRCPRIETALQECLLKAESFDGLGKLLKDSLFKGMSDRPRTVALKTIAAYRGGLDLRAVAEKEARADFLEAKRAIARPERLRVSRRPVYDFFLLEAFKWAGDSGLPVQVHCGIGDDDAYLPLSNPLCLQPVIKSERFATSFVFLHCYPFVKEAAYLAALYPNVYLDLSLSLTLAAPAGESILFDALAAAPTSKILAGTDGHSLPESHWYGAISLKNALARALSKMVESDFLSETHAYDIAARILHENAKKVYGLDDLV